MKRKGTTRSNQPRGMCRFVLVSRRVPTMPATAIADTPIRNTMPRATSNSFSSRKGRVGFRKTVPSDVRTVGGDKLPQQILRSGQGIRGRSDHGAENEGKQKERRNERKGGGKRE